MGCRPAWTTKLPRRAKNWRQPWLRPRTHWPLVKALSPQTLNQALRQLHWRPISPTPSRPWPNRLPACCHPSPAIRRRSRRSPRPWLRPKRKVGSRRRNGPRWPKPDSPPPNRASRVAFHRVRRGPWGAIWRRNWPNGGPVWVRAVAPPPPKLSSRACAADRSWGRVGAGSIADPAKRRSISRIAHAPRAENRPG